MGKNNLKYKIKSAVYSCPKINKDLLCLSCNIQQLKCILNSNIPKKKKKSKKF